MISLDITVQTYTHTLTHTQRHTVHIQTCACSERIETKRPGLAVQDLLVFGVPSILRANGQTGRVNSVR